MKRITISLPDDLAERIAREARRRRVSVSQIHREFAEAKLGRSGERRELPFVGIGRSKEPTNIARDLKDRMKEWGDYIERDSFDRDR